MNIVEAVKKKKSLRKLDNSLIEINQKINPEKKKNIIKIIKETRNYWNRMYGQFWEKEHKSFNERATFYTELYTKIFAINNFKTILDISAGLNPLSYKLIPNYKKKKFIVTELTTIDCEFLRNYLLKEKINSEVYRIDLRKDFSLNGDICFLFKILDLFDHKTAERILKSVNCPIIVVSFSTITIKGNKMNYPKRGWFEQMIRRLDFKFEILNFKNEIFYILKKN
ncbi:hypothetical protein J4436_01190 [Candidatus Woesearchaeota archaeon]|nr:hypothetical protein [Candidatus Woesearchaeota archaeon]